MRKVLSILLMVSAVAAAKQYEIYHPTITRGVMYRPGQLRYNHDSTIEFFQGKFYGAWNGNENRWEGKPGQKNYWATSDDGLNWSPEIVFSNVPSFGLPEWQTEWQPNLLNWKNRELWCFWTKSGGFIFSKLNADKTGWDHRVVWESVTLKGQPYSTFPTQNPTVLADGSVMIPCVFRLPKEVEPIVEKQTYYSGPIITRDGGDTFFVPEGALIEHPEKEKLKMWEPMYVVQEDGRVRMFNRTLSLGVDTSQMPSNALITADGSADGERMEPPVYSAIRTVHSRMWLGQTGSRRLMVHSDSMRNMFPLDRINIAFFSSRTGRDDFVAGVPIEDGLISISYPQAVFVSNAAYVCYSYQFDPASIMVSKVDPLPVDDRWYIFPRSGNRSLTGNDQPRPVPASTNSDGTVNPSYLEFYAAANEVEAGIPNEIGTNSVTITGWISRKPKSNGVLFNALSSDGLKGFSLRLEYDGKMFVTLGGEKKGTDIILPDPLKSAGLAEQNGWDYSPWFFFAVTIDNEQGRVFYWNGQSLSASAKFKARTDFSSGKVPGLGRPISQQFARNHYPPYIKVNSIRVYGRALGSEEIRYDYNRFISAADTGVSVNDPGNPIWKLDFNSYSSDFLCVKNRRPLSMPVEQNGNLLTFSGNSSAGVDLEIFDPGQDAIEVTLPVKLERASVSETVVLMTLGDDNDIMIGLRLNDPDRVYVNCTGEWVPACRFKTGEQNLLSVHMDKSGVTVANGQEAVTVSNNSIGQRLYLGDGYPGFYIAPADRFTVDVEKFKATVIRGGASAKYGSFAK
ncbi:MAG: hypothetical protein WCG03_03370 [Kiritimatiellales bacterium]